MPRYLTDQDIADFRAELCKVATERFARFGYEGVTMRQLAEALGCSPKTPYRYFKDKADILATVRAQAFGSFARAWAGVLTQAQRDRWDEAGPKVQSPTRLGSGPLTIGLAHPEGFHVVNGATALPSYIWP